MRIGRGAVAVAVLAAPLAGTALAEDLGTGRRVQNTVRVESVEVDDVPGHELGLVEFTGLTFYEGGEVARHRNPAIFDLTDGVGPNHGYVVHTFEDGSTSVERYSGAVLEGQSGGRHAVGGTFECIRGTGRFEGIRGEGTWRAERYGPLEEGSYVVVDFEGSCRVP